MRKNSKDWLWGSFGGCRGECKKGCTLNYSTELFVLSLLFWCWRLNMLVQCASVLHMLSLSSTTEPHLLPRDYHSLFNAIIELQLFGRPPLFWGKVLWSIEGVKGVKPESDIWLREKLHMSTCGLLWNPSGCSEKNLPHPSNFYDYLHPKTLGKSKQKLWESCGTELFVCLCVCLLVWMEASPEHDELCWLLLELGERFLSVATFCFPSYLFSCTFHFLFILSS